MFNQEVYNRRFTAERSFAWIDKFRALLIRYDRRDILLLVCSLHRFCHDQFAKCHKFLKVSISSLLKMGVKTKINFFANGRITRQQMEPGRRPPQRAARLGG